MLMVSINEKVPNQIVFINCFLAINRHVIKIIKRNPVPYQAVVKGIFNTYAAEMPIIRQSVNLIIVKFKSRMVL